MRSLPESALHIVVVVFLNLVFFTAHGALTFLSDYYFSLAFKRCQEISIPQQQIVPKAEYYSYLQAVKLIN